MAMHDIRVTGAEFKEIMAGRQRAIVTRNQNFELGALLTIREMMPNELKDTGKTGIFMVTNVQAPKETVMSTNYTVLSIKPFEPGQVAT